MKKVVFVILIAAAFSSCYAKGGGESAEVSRRAEPGAVSGKEDVMDSSILKEKLTKRQFEVTQLCSTEPAFQNEYWDNKAEGLYVDVVSGVPLFSSKDKFDSGTGWPSFTKPIFDHAVDEKKDSSYGMVRTEVQGSASKAHLGHVFDDGPAETGLRYCINSASLRFIPEEDLEKEGYAHYRTARGREAALFAAGCFWGTEGYFRQLAGVVSTDVGYSGGITEHPSYEQVVTGKTGHAETLLIEFDPAVISYKELLVHFFRMHDPTTLNRQGNDRGTQYRSAVFTVSDAQRAAAEETVRELEKKGLYDKPIVTEIREAGAFYSAEEYHQDYLKKNPYGYCHVDLSLATKPLETGK